MDITAVSDDDDLPKRGRPPIRDWNLWLQLNKKVTLYSGEDFDCDRASIRQQAYTKAKERGGRVKVKYREDLRRPAIELTFVPSGTVQRLPSVSEPDRNDGHLTEAEIDALYRQVHPEAFETESILDNSDLPRSIDEVDDFDFPTTSSREAADNLIDDPTKRQGQKWGPPE
jgi:hypothetical protein